MNGWYDKLLNDLSKEESFDVTSRNINKEYTLVYLNFLTNSTSINRVIYTLNVFTDKKMKLSEVLLNENTRTANNYEDLYDMVLLGCIAIFSKSFNEVYLCDATFYPTRGIAEPESEKVVRGSRDGFCENIAINISLIRRRIKSGKLKVLKYMIGDISKTIVTLIYLEDFVNNEYLEVVKNKLEHIKVDELTMGDKALEELLVNNKYTPYPLVKYTERPDTFSSHLYQGMFGILVDTSPCAILGPISLFDHLQHVEEFRQTFITGSYLRFIRLIGIILSFIAVPVWFCLLEFENLNILFLGDFFNVDFAKPIILLQILMMELGVEFIRMASIHTPNALSTSMGLVAGIIIGELAINLGIISEQIVLLGAISAIGSYITPSYELSLANKISKLLLVFVSYLFGIKGFIIGIILLIIYLMNLKSFGRRYLYPLIPFDYKELLSQIFRKPYHRKQHNNKD